MFLFERLHVYVKMFLVFDLLCLLVCLFQNAFGACFLMLLNVVYVMGKGLYRDRLTQNLGRASLVGDGMK